jgi:uncharacterized protein YodC (DUF2158 family)
METSFLKIGQKVKQESGTQVMEVIGFDPGFIENVITQWEDESGNILTAKFKQDQLVPAK